MIIIDSKNGNLVNANKLKKYNSSSLSEGDVVIYKENVLTDIIVIKTWEELLRSVPRLPKLILKQAFDKISKKENIVNIHLVILGNKSVFLNKNKAKHIQEIRMIDDYIDKCRKEDVLVVNFKSYPSIADYVVDTDRRSQINMKEVKKEPVVNIPKVGLRRMPTFIVHPEPPKVLEEVVPEVVPEVVTTKAVSIMNIDINMEKTVSTESVTHWDEKEDNILTETPSVELIKSMWISIPGITDKIIDSLMSITSISGLYNGNVSEISAAKYNTGTRFGIGRARNLIESAKSSDTFALILSNISELTKEERDSIVSNYTLGNIIDNKDKLAELYPNSIEKIMLLGYKS